MKNKRTINRKITNEQFYYIAGIIDSGSTFTLGKWSAGRKNNITGERSTKWVGGFSVHHTNPLLIKTLRDILFLGDSHTHISNMKLTGHNNRIVKSIRIYGPILDEILPKLVNFLIVKKEHALVMLDFRETLTTVKYGRYDPIPAHIEKYREELKDKIKFLNSQSYKDNLFGERQIAKDPHICRNPTMI